MTNTEIVPGTPDLLKRFYGEIPARRTRTLVVKEDEEVVWVAGLYVQDCAQILFGDFKPGIDRPRYKREYVQCMRRLLAMAQERDLPLYSKAKPTVEGSDRLLAHFGFEPVTDEVYVWRH